MKKVKIYVVRQYGYYENLYDDSYGYALFKKHFLELFNTEKKDIVERNLESIEYIYDNNYACFDGFFDSMFYALFHNAKQYAQFRKVLQKDNFNKKDFWQLGIL
jgi:hypothetical protein